MRRQANSEGPRQAHLPAITRKWVEEAVVA